MKIVSKLFLLLVMSFLVLPGIALAAGPIISIDVDPSTDGIQDVYDFSGRLLPDTFTADVVLTLPDPSATLSSISYSIWWDMAELDTPEASDITTMLIGPGWFEITPPVIDEPYIRRINQGTFGTPAAGAMETVIASIEWTIPTSWKHNDDPRVMDIMPGFFSPGDGAFDGEGIGIPEVNGISDGNSIEFRGANVVPEPVSTVLFIIGGATLGVRRFWKSRK